MVLGLHHLVLFYRDTEVARDWLWRAGFSYLRGHERMHWFQLGEAEIMVHPADRSSGGGPVIHVTVANAKVHFDNVRAQGLEPQDHQRPGVLLDGPVTRPWGAVEFELQDPEGHWWAFTQK